VNPPILLLHGFSGSGRSWSDPLLSGLGVDRRLLTPDLPGHGGDRTPRDPVDFEMHRVVDHLVRELDHLGIERADWVGYSMGGRVALAAAILRSDRVRRLVLESASPGIADPLAREERKKQDRELAARIERKGAVWFADYWESNPLFESRRSLPDAERGGLKAIRLAQDPAGLAAALRGFGTGEQPSWWADLPEVKHPTLLLTGALDTRFTSLAREMSAALPQAVHRVFPDVGHTVHLEAASDWLESVRSWTAREVGGGSCKESP